MNGISATRSSALSGYRAAAHIIAGLELFAVVALLTWIIPGAELPKWELLLNVVVAAALLIAAYPTGLVIDDIATKLWRLIGREFRDERSLREWNARRTDHPLADDSQETAADLRQNETWWRAQRWLWKSEGARAELGNLRLQMMVGKDSALNALLAWLLCIGGLWLGPVDMYVRTIPFHVLFMSAFGSPEAQAVPMPIADARLLIAGAGIILFVALWIVLISPRRSTTRSWAPAELRFWGRWGAGVLSVLVTVGFLLWFVRLLGALSGANSSFVLLAIGAALGPWFVFAFMYVRVDANRLYLGLVQEATEIGPPGGDHWPPKLVREQ